MNAYFILICCFISVNTESTEGAGEDASHLHEDFHLGPYAAKAPFDKPVQLTKYPALTLSDRLASNRIFSIAKCVAQIDSQLGFLDPFYVAHPNVSDLKAPFEEPKLLSVPLQVQGDSNIDGPIQLENLEVTGLKHLTVDNLEVRKKFTFKKHRGLIRVDVNSSAPLVSVEFDYSIPDHAGFLHFNLTGKVRASLEHVKSIVALEVALKNSSDGVLLEVQEGESEITAEDLKVEVTFKSFGQKGTLTKEILQQIVDQIKAPVVRATGQQLKSLLNRALATLPSKMALKLVDDNGLLSN